MSTAMNDKVCLVTGSNSGIGLETVVGLARQGATVVMACRDSKKSRDALEDARRRGGAAVELMTVDLSSQKSIRNLAREFIDRFPRLDVLVHNAGIFTYGRSLTVDGTETQFAVNLLAPYLLTLLLRKPLEAAAPSRVVIVASDSHRMGWLNFDNLQGEKRYVGALQYGHTKLAVVLMGQVMAKQLQEKRITVNSLHPGTVQTPMLENAVPGVFYPLVRLFLKTPEEGAKTSLYAAVSPEAAKITGKYFKDSKETPLASRARNEAKAGKIWEVCGNVTGERP